MHGDILCQQKSGTALLVICEQRDMKQQLIPMVCFNCENQALGTINKHVSSNHVTPSSSASA